MPVASCPRVERRRGWLRSCERPYLEFRVPPDCFFAVCRAPARVRHDGSPTLTSPSTAAQSQHLTHARTAKANPIADILQIGTYETRHSPFQHRRKENPTRLRNSESIYVWNAGGGGTTEMDDGGVTTLTRCGRDRGGLRGGGDITLTCSDWGAGRTAVTFWGGRGGRFGP